MDFKFYFKFYFKFASLAELVGCGSLNTVPLTA